MNIPYFVISLLLIITQFCYAQPVNPDNITIIRDEYGVPYIYSKTDQEAVYGLAWAQAEDSFFDLQEPLLASKGLLSAVSGKKGAFLDAVSFLIGTDKIVKEKYESTFSDKFKGILSGYIQGLNRYATLHPDEVRHKKLFPLTEQDIIKTYVFNMALISNIHFDLRRIFENELGPIELDEFPSGSNGIAIAPSKTTDQKTYLLSNSHQPLEGFASWYEVQIQTEEGWQVHGASFILGVTPFVGVNPNLGWTHTINYDDFHDVYRLEMHPEKKNWYRFDGEWIPLELRKLKLKVKVGPIRIPVSRNFYWSKHGPVVKNKSGYFAMRFPANMVIGQAEQWYRMNKANTFEEFYAALELQQLVSTNIIYADKEGNNMFLGNGLFPYRNPDYDWRKILPGDTSATLWEPRFMPLDSLVKIVNPKCGFTFNMNNTGFDCTCEEENPRKENYNATMGHQLGRTGRSLRFHTLIDTMPLVSYQDFKRIKYDLYVDFPLFTRGVQNFDLIRQLDPQKYPDIKESINVVLKWNGSAEVDNKQAALVSLAIQHLLGYMDEEQIRELNNDLPEEEYVNALRFAQKHLLKYFGKLEIELGELQKHVRGDKELPIWGIPEVIAQMYTKPYKNGKLKSVLGESFILFAVYGKEGIEKIETINCYGASSREESPHYTDQMELFVNMQLRTITLDKATNLKKAESVYKPK